MPDNEERYGFPEPPRPIHDDITEEQADEKFGRLRERVNELQSTPVPIEELTGQQSLQSELSSVLNRYSAENGSGTPDFILAEYLLGCLEAFNKAHKRRAEWHGQPLDEYGMSRDEQFVQKDLEP